MLTRHAACESPPKLRRHAGVRDDRPPEGRDATDDGTRTTASDLDLAANCRSDADRPEICDAWNQRSYEMPARPRALKRVVSDARVRLPGASSSATFMAE